MKHALLSPAILAAFALTFTSLPTPAAESSSPSNSAKKAPFQLSFVYVTSPEQERAARELARTRELYKRGQISNEEVAQQTAIYEGLERSSKIAVTLRSEGGPLSELLKMLEGGDESVPSLTVINVGEPSDLNAKLPPFTLSRVQWSTFIEVLSKLLASQGLELSYAGSDSSNTVETKSAVCVLRRTAPSAPAVASTQTGFGAFGLSDYIYREQTVDVIVDAIRTAWALDPERARNPDALQLKFHPGTKILLVSGPAPADAIARQVINSLAKKPEKIF